MVRIETPASSGTGFLFASTDNLLGIATAAHVVRHAWMWEQPIRLTLAVTEQTVLLRPDDLAVFLKSEADSASLVIGRDQLDFSETCLDLTPEDHYLKLGNHVGWMGFPVVAPQHLCFFAGYVSAYNIEASMYLVDGVAINGVSGGPAFCCLNDGRLLLIGLVSAYLPNTATGETLPGLCVIRDVRHQQQVVNDLRTLDEAKAREEEPGEVDLQQARDPNQIHREEKK